MSDNSSAESGSIQQQVLDSAETRASKSTYEFTKRCIRAVLWPYFSVEFQNRAGLNIEGPVIYAPLHRSNLDSPLIAAGATRRYRALAKASMFKNKGFAWFIAALGAFPVERGAADRDALRSALMLLERGEPILVFPEGTRQVGPEVGEIFDGVAYLASKSGAAVVPVGIAGTEESMPPGAKFPKRTKVTVAVGDPMYVQLNEKGRLTRSARETFSSDLRAALQVLSDQARAARKEA